MSVAKFRPITPGLRFKVASGFSGITASKPEKSLIAPLKRTGGRNNVGKMTMRYMGGGHKKKYRVIDVKRDKFGVEAKVASIEYDPNRTARIALLYYADGEKRYIIAPNKLQVGDTLISDKKSVPVKDGNAMQLKHMPFGAAVHAIELVPGKGASMARSAGSYATVMAKEEKFVTVKLPSGEVRRIHSGCMATLGVVSNSERINEQLGKAGRNRWLGRRPRVRGVAMNPVDHPMGGGEGKASGGHPRSRKGLIAKGYKTRNKKKMSSKYIISGRK